MLPPMLEGVLRATGVVDDGESIERTFRLSELTLVVTDARLLKHVGGTVWDGSFEAIDYDDATDLGFEEGEVVASIVLSANDRRERVKAPAADARAVHGALSDALLAHHDVESLDAFRAPREADEADGGAEADDGSAADDPAAAFDGGPGTLGGDPAGDCSADGIGDEGAGGIDPSTRSAPAAEGEVTAEVADLRRAVERQGERLDRQAALIEELIEAVEEPRHDR